MQKASGPGPTRGEPHLVVEHMTMRFGGLVAVNDVSFAARAGDITAIIGPNGAGKTTVFNCITGFYKPTTGRIALYAGPAGPGVLDAVTHSGRRWSGPVFLLERMPDFEIAAKARIARTFQNIRLFSGMTVLENLIVAQHNKLMDASGWSLKGLAGAASYRAAEKEAVRLAASWLERIGLADRADDAAGDLPYGAQRRLEIARAMCTEPVLLCLDEPAAGLNPREVGRAQPAVEIDPAGERHLDPVDRARHVRGDGDLRPHRRPRVRDKDFGRHARGGAQRSEGDCGVSGGGG